MTASAKILETVTVALGARSYDITVGTNLIANLGSAIKPHLKRDHVVVITDENVGAIYLTLAMAALDSAGITAKSITLPAGEATKSFAQYEALIEELLALGGERSDTLIALGGGVIGDLTGFAAASLRRGMSFIQVPTSLLAQVDSSVGGKTGINTKAGKNLVGAFHQPRAVIIDIDTLKTLPKRELLAGYAEVVKYGLIDKPDFFEWLEVMGEALLAGDSFIQSETIAQCCKSKADIVAADEFEGGKRALLNLGHTFGHSLEAECGYDGSLLHGEAVAIGLVLAHELSAEMGLIDQAIAARIAKHLKSIGLPVAIGDLNRPFDIDTLINHMSKDKKVVDGAIAFILSQGLGEAFITRDVPIDLLAKVMRASSSK